jgi:TonB family protein
VNSTLAQSDAGTVKLFDKKWFPTRDTARAEYYRTVEQQDGKFLLKDYYFSTKSLYLEAVCSTLQPKPVYDGRATWYYRNGNMERTGEFLAGEPVDIHKAYYEDGTLKYERKHQGEKVFYIIYRSPEGTALLEKGNGVVIEDQDLLGKVYLEFRDSVAYGSYFIESSGDTLHITAEKEASYTGGMAEFYRGVQKQVVYPREARRRGIEGKVFIGFTVGKNGAMENATVLKGIGGGCDEAALQACMAQKGWIPAQCGGKPVRMRMALPVTFDLKGWGLK